MHLCDQTSPQFVQQLVQNSASKFASVILTSIPKADKLRKKAVSFDTNPEVRNLPQVVNRHDDGLRVRDVRRGTQQVRALLQRLADQRQPASTHSRSLSILQFASLLSEVGVLLQNRQRLTCIHGRYVHNAVRTYVCLRHVSMYASGLGVRLHLCSRHARSIRLVNKDGKLSA